MQASVKAFDMIRFWEALDLNAYYDPASGNLPITIGWGSTKNMDTGALIHMGDTIDRATADRWLKMEIEYCAEAVSRTLAGIPINQNRFDALVSLAYNQGPAFGKTLIHALRAQDWDLAAKTFALYHHDEHGRDVQGLINRRNKELSELFNVPMKDTPPEPVKTDTSYYVELYQSGVAYVIGNPTGKARDKCDTLQNCSNLGKVAEMAAIWKAGKFVNVHAEEDEPIVEKYAPVPPVGEVTLKFSREAPGVLDSRGLEVLKLELMQDGQVLQSWKACSGQPYSYQNFICGGVGERAGSMYPCGSGEYSVEDFYWYGGKDNWNASGGAGLGPLFIPFNPTFSTPRGSYGIHFDSNAGTSPGSAGCCTLNSMEDLKSVCAALRKYDPRKMSVIW